MQRLTNAIKDSFGSKRGFFKYVLFKVLTVLGYFRKYSQVDWSRVDRLVFVCHGNICRSPLGEAVAKSREANAISLGIACKDGALADPRAIAFAHTVGIDLSQHRSQNLRSIEITPDDLIVVMEPKHLEHFTSLSKTDVQLTLAGLWESNPCAYIHDPYCANEKFFSRCEQRVVAASLALLAAK